MKDKVEATKDELIEQCLVLEREYEQIEESVNKFIRSEEEHSWKVRSELAKLETEEFDCLGDKKLLGLIDEKRTLLKKIERQHEDVQSTLRRELRNKREVSDSMIDAIRKQINDMK